MIKSLLIKNFILIDELKLDFENGFSAICGETGAGKSIIIRAIDTVLGAKATKELIKGEGTALIEMELDDVTISREMTQSSSKYRLNGALSSLDEIKCATEGLVDIHSQNQTYIYLQKKYHIKLLDDYISRKNSEFLIIRENFEERFLELSKIKKRIEHIESLNEQNLRQADFLRFQINEIESAEILENEQENLEAELEVLSNVSFLKESTYGAYYALNGDDNSICEALSKIDVLISKSSSLDKNLSDIQTAFIEGVENLKFVSNELRNYYESVSDDPARLDEINERLSLIEKLKRKYGKLDEALDGFKKELSEIEVDINELDSLKEQASVLEKYLGETSKNLSEERKKYALELSELVCAELKKLEFEYAKFEISIKEVSMNANGVDDVEFLITTNLSKPLSPLAKTASGGELSRVMLAIKTLFADCSAIIFDEIDTGISGKTSQATALEISLLSKDVQVFAITHQPIIASKADVIYWVEKTQKDGETKVSVEKLTKENKAKALAQMASGEVTQTSLTFVNDLLNS